MTLDDWLNIPNEDGTKKNRGAFAHDLGVTPQMISAYCGGKVWPSKDVMRKIVEKTDGAVTANDFINLEPETRKRFSVA